ncbi:MAG TPA: helicase-exonuclease AddAB subunit AddA [Clostridiales bacterium]|nr:helicase-exonuclease AddAB subunit AddA [Clostridiales bacterium]
MPLTDHQELAAESRGGARLVSAAAGSGKTKVLVERLMRYVDRGADIDQFLVITYTRAAAAELRSRILSALGERIAADPMNRRLRRQTELCCRASIGTIDSICGRFLRENTHLAGISPDYRVIEPDRSDEICARVLDKLLEELYETIEEDAGVRALVDSFGSGDNDDRLSALVLRLYKSLQSHADPDAWLAEQRERLTDAWNDAGDTPWGQYLLSRTRSQAQYWAERIEELRLRLDEPDRDAKIKKAYTNNLDFAGDAARDMARAVALGWDKARLACPGSFPRRGIYKGDDPLAQRIIAVWTGFKDTAAKWQELFANDSDALLRDLAVNTPAVDALLALTQKLGAAFAAEKKRQGVCDFSDQEHLVLKLLTDTSNGLAAALSSRYTEVLVDEYQDVNACQDALFRLLSDNGRKLFMVGDVKQSIYRFRLADPGIFLQKYEAYAPYTQAQDDEPRKILLSDNFRSRKEVLAAANDVFSLCMQGGELELTYGEAEKLRAGLSYPDTTQPKVELHCIELSKAETDEQSPQKRETEADFVAARIRRMLDEKMQVSSGGVLRDVQPGDIVILMRAVGDNAASYQSALSKQSIASRCDRGGSLFDTTEAQVLLAALKVIDNPHRDVELVTALSSPAFGVPPEDLARARGKLRTGDFYDCLLSMEDRGQALDSFLSWLSEMREQSRLLPLGELLDLVLQTTAMEDVFSAMEDGAARRENLQLLCAQASAFSATGNQSLMGFLRYMDELEESGQLPSSRAQAGPADAVQIMTIHQSKGLEFPVVFLADLSRQFNRSDASMSVLLDSSLYIGANVVDMEKRAYFPSLARMAIAEKKTRQTIAEELRVLYVAMTRAKEMLVMSYCSGKLSSTLKKWNEALTLPLPPRTAGSALCLGDWVLMAALCRTEAGELFAETGPNDVSSVQNIPWLIQLHRSSEQMQTALPEAAPEMPETEKPAAPDYDFAPYAHLAASNMPSKLTATALKGRLLDLEAAEQTPQETKNPERFRLPVFGAKKKLSGRARGSATHLFMQFADYNACRTADGIEQELERLTREKFLTPEQAQGVEKVRIERLFAAPFGARILQAEKLHREFKFSLLTDAVEFAPAAAGEQVMLQGVVDCFWEEADGIVLVDFKTDRTPDGPQACAARYCAQLNAYAKALTRIYGAPVKEKILYFFSCDCAYHLD